MLLMNCPVCGRFVSRKQEPVRQLITVNSNELIQTLLPAPRETAGKCPSGHIFYVYVEPGGGSYARVDLPKP